MKIFRVFDIIFVFLSRTEYVSDYPALLIELKWNQSAGAAIQQIKERQYPCTLEAYMGDMLLVGISYDQKNKEHSCMIERFVKIK